MPPYPFGKGPIAVAFETFVQDTDRALSMLKSVWNDPLGKNEPFRKTLKKADRDHLDEILYPEDHLPAGASQQERNEARRDGEKRRDAVRNGIKGALILALGVHNPLRRCLCLREHRLHDEAGAEHEAVEALGVSGEIRDRPRGDARIHRSLRDSGRDLDDQARIERLRNQIFRTE